MEIIFWFKASKFLKLEDLLTGVNQNHTVFGNIIHMQYQRIGLYLWCMYANVNWVKKLQLQDSKLANFQAKKEHSLKEIYILFELT